MIRYVQITEEGIEKVKSAVSHEQRPPHHRNHPTGSLSIRRRPSKPILPCPFRRRRHRHHRRGNLAPPPVILVG